MQRAGRYAIAGGSVLLLLFLFYFFYNLCYKFFGRFKRREEMRRNNNCSISGNILCSFFCSFFTIKLRFSLRLKILRFFHKSLFYDTFPSSLFCVGSNLYKSVNHVNYSRNFVTRTQLTITIFKGLKISTT